MFKAAPVPHNGENVIKCLKRNCTFQNNMEYGELWGIKSSHLKGRRHIRLRCASSRQLSRTCTNDFVLTTKSSPSISLIPLSNMPQSSSDQEKKGRIYKPGTLESLLSRSLFLVRDLCCFGSRCGHSSFTSKYNCEAFSSVYS